jgi:transposase-like protein
MGVQNQLIERRIYGIELQHKICKEHIEAGVKLCDLQRKYNLSSHSLIHDWLRKLGYLPGYRRRTRLEYIGIDSSSSTLNKNPSKDTSLTAEQKQIQQLTKELEDVKILAEGYRRMIEIAEQELKISIRKKHNTK